MAEWDCGIKYTDFTDEDNNAIDEEGSGIIE